MLIQLPQQTDPEQQHLADEIQHPDFYSTVHRSEFADHQPMPEPKAA